MKNIIEASPGEYIGKFFDRMLKCVSDTKAAVCGVFNDHLFTACADAKEYSDIECLSYKHNSSDKTALEKCDSMEHKARLENQLDVLEKTQKRALVNGNYEAVVKLSAQMLATIAALEQLDNFTQ